MNEQKKQNLNSAAVFTLLVGAGALGVVAGWTLRGSGPVVPNKELFSTKMDLAWCYMIINKVDEATPEVLKAAVSAAEAELETGLAAAAAAV